MMNLLESGGGGGLEIKGRTLLKKTNKSSNYVMVNKIGLRRGGNSNKQPLFTFRRRSVPLILNQRMLRNDRIKTGIEHSAPQVAAKGHTGTWGPRTDQQKLDKSMLEHTNSEAL